MSQTNFAHASDAWRAVSIIKIRRSVSRRRPACAHDHDESPGGYPTIILRLYSVGHYISPSSRPPNSTSSLHRIFFRRQNESSPKENHHILSTTCGPIAAADSPRCLGFLCARFSISVPACLALFTNCTISLGRICLGDWRFVRDWQRYCNSTGK